MLVDYCELQTLLKKGYADQFGVWLTYRKCGYKTQALIKEGELQSFRYYLSLLKDNRWVYINDHKQFQREVVALLGCYCPGICIETPPEEQLADGCGLVNSQLDLEAILLALQTVNCE